MRIIVMFDMPTLSQQNLRDYRQFHKFLTREGFVMMQESIYCKLALNASTSDAVKEKVKKNKPPIGNVAMLVVTETQFAKIEYLAGKKQSKIVDDDKRLVIL